MYIFANLTDLYILRRILDKDYISKITTYSGVLHSHNYIKILVSDFGFKITHARFTRMSVDYLKSEIKTSLDPIKLIDWSLMPDYMSQCSDMTNFPDDLD